MAVTRHVRFFEIGRTDTPWYAERLEQQLNSKLRQGERIVSIRWPESGETKCCWVITEELIMGPPLVPNHET